MPEATNNTNQVQQAGFPTAPLPSQPTVPSYYEAARMFQEDAMRRLGILNLDAYKPKIAPVDPNQVLSQSNPITAVLNRNTDEAQKAAQNKRELDNLVQKIRHSANDTYAGRQASFAPAIERNAIRERNYWGAAGEPRKIGLNEAYDIVGGTALARYPTYTPGLNNEEIAARNQSTAQKWGRGIGKLATKTALYGVGGVANLFYGTAAAIGQMRLSAFYDNSFMDFVNDVDERINHTLAHYYSEEEKNMNFFQKMGTANFWANDVIGSGLSFTTGAFLTAYLTGGLGFGGLTSSLIRGGAATAARTAGAASRALGAGLSEAATGGRVAQMAGNVASAGRAVAQANSRIGRIQEGAIRAGRAVRGLFTKAPSQTAAEAIKDMFKPSIRAITRNAAIGNSIKTLTTLGFGSAWESAVEANSAFKQNEQDFKDYYKTIYNREPTQEEMSAFYETNANISNGVFAANMAIVGLSNFAQFGRYMGVGRKFFDKAITKPMGDFGRIANRYLFGVGVKTGKSGALEVVKGNVAQKVAGTLYNVARPMFTEGVFEEGLQGVASRAAEDYVKSRYDKTYLTDTATFMDSIRKGFADTYGTQEGFMEIGIGALIGAGMNFRNRFGLSQRSERIQQLEQAVKDYNENRAFTLPQVKEVLRNTATLNAMGVYDNGGDMTTLFGDTNDAASEYTKFALSDSMGMLDSHAKDFENLINSLDDAELAQELGVSEEQAKEFKKTALDDYKKNLNTYKEARDFGRKVTDGTGYERLSDYVAQVYYGGMSSYARIAEISDKIGLITANPNVADSLKVVSNLRNQTLKQANRMVNLGQRVAELEREVQRIGTDPNRVDENGVDTKRNELLRKTEELERLRDEYDRGVAALSNMSADDFSYDEFTRTTDDLLQAASPTGEQVLAAYDSLAVVDQYMRSKREEDLTDKDRALQQLAREFRDNVTNYKNIRNMISAFSDKNFTMEHMSHLSSLIRRQIEANPIATDGRTIQDPSVVQTDANIDKAVENGEMTIEEGYTAKVFNHLNDRIADARPTENTSTIISDDLLNDTASIQEISSAVSYIADKIVNQGENSLTERERQFRDMYPDSVNDRIRQIGNSPRSALSRLRKRIDDYLNNEALKKENDNVISLVRSYLDANTNKRFGDLMDEYRRYLKGDKVPNSGDKQAELSRIEKELDDISIPNSNIKVSPYVQAKIKGELSGNQPSTTGQQDQTQTVGQPAPQATPRRKKQKDKDASNVNQSQNAPNVVSPPSIPAGNSDGQPFNKDGTPADAPVGDDAIPNPIVAIGGSVSAYRPMYVLSKRATLDKGATKVIDVKNISFGDFRRITNLQTGQGIEIRSSYPQNRAYEIIFITFPNGESVNVIDRGENGFYIPEEKLDLFNIYTDAIIRPSKKDAIIGLRQGDNVVPFDAGSNIDKEAVAKLRGSSAEGVRDGTKVRFVVDRNDPENQKLLAALKDGYDTGNDFSDAFARAVRIRIETEDGKLLGYLPSVPNEGKVNSVRAGAQYRIEKSETGTVLIGESTVSFTQPGQTLSGLNGRGPVLYDIPISSHTRIVGITGFQNGQIISQVGEAAPRPDDTYRSARAESKRNGNRMIFYAILERENGEFYPHPIQLKPEAEQSGDWIDTFRESFQSYFNDEGDFVGIENINELKDIIQRYNNELVNHGIPLERGITLSSDNLSDYEAPIRDALNTMNRRTVAAYAMMDPSGNPQELASEYARIDVDLNEQVYYSPVFGVFTEETMAPSESSDKGTSIGEENNSERKQDSDDTNTGDRTKTPSTETRQEEEGSEGNGRTEAQTPQDEWEIPDYPYGQGNNKNFRERLRALDKAEPTSYLDWLYRQFGRGLRFFQGGNRANTPITNLTGIKRLTDLLFFVDGNGNTIDGGKKGKGNNHGLGRADNAKTGARAGMPVNEFPAWLKKQADSNPVVRDYLALVKGATDHDTDMAILRDLRTAIMAIDNSPANAVNYSVSEYNATHDDKLDYVQNNALTQEEKDALNARVNGILSSIGGKSIDEAVTALENAVNNPTPENIKAAKDAAPGINLVEAVKEAADMSPEGEGKEALGNAAKKIEEKEKELTMEERVADVRKEISGMSTEDAIFTLSNRQKASVQQGGSRDEAVDAVLAELQHWPKEGLNKHPDDGHYYNAARQSYLRGEYMKRMEGMSIDEQIGYLDALLNDPRWDVLDGALTTLAQLRAVKKHGNIVYDTRDAMKVATRAFDSATEAEVRKYYESLFPENATIKEKLDILKQVKKTWRKDRFGVPYVADLMEKELKQEDKQNGRKQNKTSAQNSANAQATGEGANASGSTARRSPRVRGQAPAGEPDGGRVDDRDELSAQIYAEDGTIVDSVAVKDFVILPRSSYGKLLDFGEVSNPYDGVRKSNPPKQGETRLDLAKRHMQFIEGTNWVYEFMAGKGKNLKDHYNFYNIQTGEAFSLTSRGGTGATRNALRVSDLTTMQYRHFLSQKERIGYTPGVALKGKEIIDFANMNSAFAETNKACPTKNTGKK